MKFLLGLVIGLVLAAGIAAGAAYMAFGDLSDVGARDKSQDIAEVYDLRDFDRVDAGGVYEIDVTVGPDYSVRVEGAPDEMARVEVSVENGVLKLGQKRPEKRRIRNNLGLTATITLPLLVGFDIAGVAEADVTGISAEAFKANLSGVGDLNLSGTCDALEANVSGVGDLDAEDLKCKDVEVSVSGIGDASVYASESVEARVSGIGSINVYGDPERVEKHKTFLADISIR